MTTSVEPTNARLRRVTEAGGTDAYDGPGAGGPEKWHGNVGAFYEERRDRRTTSTSGGASDVIVWRTLIISSDLRIELENGDLVTFRKIGSSEDLVGRIQAIADTPPEPGAGGELELTLELT